MIPAGAVLAHGGDDFEDRVKFEARGDRVRIEVRNDRDLFAPLDNRLFARDLRLTHPFLFRDNILRNDLLGLRNLRIGDVLADRGLRVRTLNPFIFPDRVRFEVRADNDLRFGGLGNVLGNRIIVR